MTNALIIFIKNPELGKVKTRLARTVGDEKALAIYRQLLNITRQNAEQLKANTDCECYLFYSDFVDLDDDWSPLFFEKYVQTGADLGARMQNAFEFVLKKHPHAVIIGSDCPTLSVEILIESFEKLAENDAVIGPSTDGGYYLLGLSEENEKNTEGVLVNASNLDFVFKNIAWSTEQVLLTTQERLTENDKAFTLLEPLTDIDEEKDWLNYLQNNL